MDIVTAAGGLKMNVNRGKMTAAAVLAVTLCCGRCDRIWLAQGRNGGTAICGGWPTEGDGQLLSHV